MANHTTDPLKGLKANRRRLTASINYYRMRAEKFSEAADKSQSELDEINSQIHELEEAARDQTQGALS